MYISEVICKFKKRVAGFTLTELLVVVTLIVAMMMILLPALQSFQTGRVERAANTQLVADMNTARHMAIINGSPVYVVFFPLYSDLIATNGILNKENPNANKDFKVNDIDKNIASNNLLAGQLTSYAFHSEGSAGDQPTFIGSGVSLRNKSYLSVWKQLPRGAFIPPDQFEKLWKLNKAAEDAADQDGGWTRDISGKRYPWPRPRALNTVGFSGNLNLPLPYIGFGPNGQLLGINNDGENEYELEIATGTVLPPPKDKDSNFYLLKDAVYGETPQILERVFGKDGKPLDKRSNRVKLNMFTGKSTSPAPKMPR